MAGRAWKEAATLILTAPMKGAAPEAISSLDAGGSYAERMIMNESKKMLNSNYQVLMCKRSSKSKFMADAFVFPGGIYDTSDCSKEWINCFNKYGNGKDYKQVILPSDIPRPLLIQNSSVNESLHRDVSFRINAIRETFEETGILISSNRINREILSEWRKKINDPNSGESFLRMCLELELCPDIWNLIEWSAWLTPLGLKNQKGRRYDTVFYLHCMDNNDNKDNLSAADEQEISSLQWMNPAECIIKNLQEKLWTAPPQYYELNRLLTFNDLEKLKNFALKREKRGCSSILPVLPNVSKVHFRCYPETAIIL